MLCFKAFASAQGLEEGQSRGRERGSLLFLEMWATNFQHLPPLWFLVIGNDKRLNTGSSHCKDWSEKDFPWSIFIQDVNWAKKYPTPCPNSNCRAERERERDRTKIPHVRQDWSPEVTKISNFHRTASKGPELLLSHHPLPDFESESDRNRG